MQDGSRTIQYGRPAPPFATRLSGPYAGICRYTVESFVQHLNDLVCSQHVSGLWVWPYVCTGGNGEAAGAETSGEAAQER